jgi:hypothetical protein
LCSRAETIGKQAAGAWEWRTRTHHSLKVQMPNWKGWLCFDCLWRVHSVIIFPY